MMTIDVTCGKTETGTNWRLNLGMVTFFFLDDQNFGDLAVDGAWVCTPDGSPKNK